MSLPEPDPDPDLLLDEEGVDPALLASLEPPVRLPGRALPAWVSAPLDLELLQVEPAGEEPLPEPEPADRP